MGSTRYSYADRVHGGVECVCISLSDGLNLTNHMLFLQATKLAVTATQKTKDLGTSVNDKVRARYSTILGLCW